MGVNFANNAEIGLSDGTIVTQASGGNSGGGTGNTFWDVITATGSVKVTAASAAHGGFGFECTGASGAQGLMRKQGFNDTLGVARFYRTKETAAPASGVEAIFQVVTSGGPIVCSIGISSSGKYCVMNAVTSTVVYTSTTSRALGDRIEFCWNVGTTTSNSGYTFKLFSGSGGTPNDTTTATETKSSSIENFGTTNWDRFYAGKVSSSSWVTVLGYDDVKVSSGTNTFFGPASSPPSASFTSSAVALTASFDGSASAPVAPATSISNYAWTFGDSGTSPTNTGATVSHTYATGGTYTATLTVTDNLGNSSTAFSGSVTVAPPAGTVTVQSLGTHTGFAPNTGTALGVLADGDATTFDAATGPSSAEFDVTLQAVVPPSSGQPFKVFVLIDQVGASSSSVTAQLFEGATQRSPASGLGTPQSIPAGTGDATTGTVSGLLTFVFPWSDVQNITTGGWNALTVKLQVTAS